MIRMSLCPVRQSASVWISLAGMILAVLALFLTPARAQAPDCEQTSVLVPGQTGPESFYIEGSIAGTSGLAGSTIYWNITQSTPGTLTFSLTAAGPYTETISVPMTLDATGSGFANYYVKGAASGHTVIIETSPQCGGGTPQCNNHVPPADYTVKPCACPPITPTP